MARRGALPLWGYPISVQLNRRAGKVRSNDEGPLPAGERPFGVRRKGQNDASSRSISDRSVCSAMARSADSFGSTVRAKNCAAATLPS